MELLFCSFPLEHILLLNSLPPFSKNNVFLKLFLFINLTENDSYNIEE